MYFDNANEKLSCSEKEGFSEVSFGEKEDCESFVNHRINECDYQLV